MAEVGKHDVVPSPGRGRLEGDRTPAGLLAFAFQLFQQAFGGPGPRLGQGRDLIQAFGELAFIEVGLQGLLVVEFEGGIDQALDVGGGDLQLLDGGVQVAAEPGLREKLFSSARERSFAPALEEGLEAVEAGLIREMSFTDSLADVTSRYLLDAGGKRVRPT